MDKKQSQFTTVDTLGDSDFVPIFGSGSNIKISKANLFDQIKDETQVFIYSTIEQLQAANLVADTEWPVYVRVEETEYRLYKITSLAAGVDDIELNNGTTATVQGEFSDIGFVVGPGVSVNGALAVFSGTTGTQIDNGPVPTTIGTSLIEAPDFDNTGYFKINPDNSVTIRSVSNHKIDLSIDQVNNTTDLNKPLSDAAVAALALKAPLASPALTGTPTVPTAAADTNTTQAASTAYVQTELLDRIQSVGTVADLAVLSLAIGQAVETKGCLSIGDGGHGKFIVETASGTPDDHSRILLANGNHAVLQPVNGVVNILQFGVVADGVADDAAGAARCHTFANENGLSVIYGCAIIGIDADAQISVNTHVDFNGCEIVVLNGTVGTPTGEGSLLKMFVIEDPDCPLQTSTETVTSTNLAQGSFTPSVGFYDDHGYLKVETELQIPNRAKTGTQNYTQAFKVNRLGRCSYPMSADCSAFATDVIFTYRKTSKSRLQLKNIRLRDEGFNSFSLFRIERCNVAIENMTVLPNSESGTYISADRIISIHDASDISIDGFITSGRQASTSLGTYALEIDGGADIYVKNMNAITGWGATGCNDISGIHYTNCILNRVDCHGGGHNMFVDAGSQLIEDGVMYGWGGGIISVSNSIVSKSAAISTRSDYGGTFFGDLVVSDTQFINAGSATLYAIDLHSEPMGASSPVYAPNTITVTNINRISKASASNAEFLPVAISIDTGTEVYAPQAIIAKTIQATGSWRFGMIVDWLSMEENPDSSTIRIDIDGAMASTAAASTTGLRDVTAATTPTSAPRPIIRCSNVYSLHVQCLATNGPDIFITDCSVNGVVVDLAAGTQPRCKIDNCSLTSVVSAVVGGTRSGNNNWTAITNCEFSASAWDISGASLLQGNYIRSGGTTPTLPGGATVATAFTGWKTGFQT